MTRIREEEDLNLDHGDNYDSYVYPLFYVEFIQCRVYPVTFMYPVPVFLQLCILSHPVVCVMPSLPYWIFIVSEIGIMAWSGTLIV